MGCVASDQIVPIPKHDFERTSRKERQAERRDVQQDVRQDVNMVDPPRVVSEHKTYTANVDRNCTRSYQEARASVQRKKQAPTRIIAINNH